MMSGVARCRQLGSQTPKFIAAILRQRPGGVKGWTSCARWGTIPFSEDFHGTHAARQGVGRSHRDRKSTRLNSSHVRISYAVFCLKKKTKLQINSTIFNSAM